MSEYRTNKIPRDQSKRVDSVSNRCVATVVLRRRVRFNRSFTGLILPIWSATSDQRLAQGDVRNDSHYMKSRACPGHEHDTIYLMKRGM